MPEIIRQHLDWIAGYCATASDANWRDVLDRIEHQIALAQRDAIDHSYAPPAKRPVKR